MGSYSRYLRIYSRSDKIRTMHFNPKEFLGELITHYPNVYEILPVSKESHDPYLIICFKKNRRTGKRAIEWILRGYEKFESFRPTIIYKPLIPIEFSAREPRDQHDCFMRLLQNGYRKINLKNLCDMYHYPCI